MPKTRSNTPSVALAALAFIIGIVAGFLAWFTIDGTGYALVSASYNAVILYATKGSSALISSSSLGATMGNNATSNPIVLVAFVLTLFFWPALLVSGIIEIARRSIGFSPFIWGLIAFISAYVFSIETKTSLGVGGYIDVVAAILCLVAYVVSKVGSKQQVATPVSTSAGTSSSPPPGQPPQGPAP